MKKKAETSKFVAILKTFGFFAVILSILGLALYLGTNSSPSKPPREEGFKSIDINDLGDFYYYSPMPGAMSDPAKLAENSIPENIKALDKTKVTISGFMMPVDVDREGRVTEFALNGNYDRCFYGAPSQINQWVHVKMHPGAYATFSHSPVSVSGTLEVGELTEGDEVISLYRLSGEKATTARRGMFN